MYAQIYFDGRASPLYAACMLACLPACLPATVDMNFRAARSCTCIPTIALGRPYPPRLSRRSGAQARRALVDSKPSVVSTVFDEAANCYIARE